MRGSRRRRIAPVGLAAVAVLVLVVALLGTGGSAPPVSEDFDAVAAAEPPTITLPASRTRTGGPLTRLHTRKLAVPNVRVLRERPGTASGLVFANPRPPSPRTRTGPMIFDEQGRVVWFHPTPRGTTTVNLRPQTYAGQPVMTWGQRPSETSKVNAYNAYTAIADASYRVIKRLRLREDEGRIDLHEFVITSRNTALMLGLRYVKRDLSRWGGRAGGTITEGIVQEVDIRTGRLLLDWHSLRRVSPSESYERPKPGRSFDYLHLNSIAVDWDGNLLLSARHTSSVYKVARRSGRVMWRLGGKRSSFRMGRGARFGYQHDARRLPNGQLQLFDNGIRSTADKVGRSRALRLELDTRRHRATLAAEYPQPARKLATSQGNAQFLPNGNVFVGWGSVERFSEFSPDGRWLWGARFPGPRWQSYRGFKSAWRGKPQGVPAVVAGRGGSSTTLVWASWNGASAIARWRVLAGPSATALEPRGEARWAGLETKIRVPDAARYVRVEALDGTGSVIGRSAAVAVR